MTESIVRCAVYTRKSSEEGLEQSFNSLAAQREACKAYILSQKHEGWTMRKDAYDDGGISGGTMDRPALKRLLSDIQGGLIDTVVVYKVDRLTRSLADFAKIIEVFDSHSVTFVSVTQQFNTTTSMGRLTLNVLLSFAQFEREITGERIRDKIAASKKKGIWMGGVVPLGYECVNRKLIVNHSEAPTVRKIFRDYLRLGCLTKLKRHLDRSNVHSKIRTNKAGRKRGGAIYSRGALHHVLCNRIYVGDIVHHREHFPGQHEAIVPPQLWDRVQSRLKHNGRAHRSAGVRAASSALTGLLFDSSGVRFTPTHSCKNGRRYRYYTSQTVIQGNSDKQQVARVPAHELENLVAKQILAFLLSPKTFVADIGDPVLRDLVENQIVELAKVWPKLERSKIERLVRTVVSRITIGRFKLLVEISKARLLGYLSGLEHKGPIATFGGEPILRLASDFEISRRREGIRIVPPDDYSPGCLPVPSIVKAIARSRDWYERFITGEFVTIEQVAKRAGLTKRYVRKILQLGHLSPKVTERLLTGQHSRRLTLNEMLHDVPLDWQQQERTILRLTGKTIQDSLDQQ
jgi:site-specific DNA recombinase